MNIDDMVIYYLMGNEQTINEINKKHKNLKNIVILGFVTTGIIIYKFQKTIKTQNGQINKLMKGE